jgi:hypothetical protein
MKVQELKRKIEELENTLFFIEMIDHWTREDQDAYDKYSNQIAELKRLLIGEVAKVAE